MRDLLLAAIMAALLPMSARRPWIGACAWAWLSLMSPQLQTYGFMLTMPVAAMVGGATLVGIVFSKEPKRFPASVPATLLIVFTAWMSVTWLFSLVPTEDNLAQLQKVLKINAFTLVTILVLHTRRQVDVFIAVVAGSIAFFGVKGGLFTVMTGGEFRVRGAGGFIAGNNEIGLAMIMIIPLLYYFVLCRQRRWVQLGLWAAIVLTVAAVVGTQSRGALVGILAMTTAFVLRSPKRSRLILPLLVITLFIVAFMPASWWDRMATIQDYNSDESARGRLNAWALALNVAMHNLFGGGFTLETESVFNRYAPDPDFIAVAHSIYFQVLGQHGFIGLALYLGFWLSVMTTCWWVARHARTPEDLALARMIEISLIGFAAGGAFLNLAYFDGPYYLMAVLVVMRHKLQRPAPKRRTAAEPARPAGTATP